MTYTRDKIVKSLAGFLLTNDLTNYRKLIEFVHDDNVLAIASMARKEAKRLGWRDVG